jgi:hypothetical protein
MHCLCEKLSCKAATESQIVVMQGEFPSGISAGGRARLQRRKPQRGLRSVVLRTRPTLSLRQPAARPTSPRMRRGSHRCRLVTACARVSAREGG